MVQPFEMRCCHKKLSSNGPRELLCTSLPIFWPSLPKLWGSFHHLSQTRILLFVPGAHSSPSCSILLVTGFLRKELVSFLVVLQIRAGCICWESTGQLLCCSWKRKPLREQRLNPHDNHMVVGNYLEVSEEQGRDFTGRAVSCDHPIHRGDSTQDFRGKWTKKTQFCVSIPQSTKTTISFKRCLLTVFKSA